MASRGDFAQALMARGIAGSSRKDSLYWALRVGGTGLDAEKYEDVLLDVTPREITTSEMMRFGKGEIVGGYKITVPGHVSAVVTSLGVTVGFLDEQVRIVRAPGWQPADVLTGDRATVIGAEDHFNVIHVHPVMNSGVVQEYWLYIQPEEGGPTRG